MCGSCTVHVDGKAERSCQILVGEAGCKKITTIEGLPGDHPVKVAWIKEQVPQCGHCQPGQIMQAAAVDDEGVLLDMDTPDDYRKVLRKMEVTG